MKQRSHKILHKIVTKAINEAFNFDDINDGADSNEEVFQSIQDDVKSQVAPEIIGRMLSKEIYPATVLQHFIDFKFIHSMQNIGFTNMDAFILQTDNILKKYVSNCACNLYYKSGYRSNKVYEEWKHTFLYNNWTPMAEHIVLRKFSNNPYIELFFARQKKEIGLSFGHVDTFEEREWFISPDEGFIGVITRAKDTYVYGYQHNYLFYSGRVEYEKVEAPMRSLFSIRSRVREWMIKQYNRYNAEPLMKSESMRVTLDKSGYPRLYCVLHHDYNLWKCLPPCCYMTNNAVTKKFWTPKLPAKHPAVLMRRNTQDGFLEAGIFMPWPLPADHPKFELKCYHKYNRGPLSDMLDQYKENPDKFGIFCVQLGPAGKQAFDEFRANNYFNKKKNQ